MYLDKFKFKSFLFRQKTTLITHKSQNIRVITITVFTLTFVKLLLIIILYFIIEQLMSTKCSNWNLWVITIDIFYKHVLHFANKVYLVRQYVLFFIKNFFGIEKCDLTQIKVKLSSFSYVTSKKN